MIRFALNSASGMRIVRLPRWALVLVLVAAAGLGLLLLILAAGVALVVIPLLVIAGGVAMLFARRQRRATGQPARPDGPRSRFDSPDVIDADFKVIDPPKR